MSLLGGIPKKSLHYAQAHIKWQKRIGPRGSGNYATTIRALEPGYVEAQCCSRGIEPHLS